MVNLVRRFNPAIGLAAKAERVLFEKRPPQFPPPAALDLAVEFPLLMRDECGRSWSLIGRYLVRHSLSRRVARIIGD